MGLTSRKRHICALAVAALFLAAGSTVPALADHEPVSPPTQAGLYPPPAPNPGPSVSGTAQDGQTLTASRGAWVNSTLTHRWIRCNANGQGCVFLHADNIDTYVLEPADVGKTIKLRVRGAGADPNSWREVDSAPTAVIEAAVPTVQTYPSNTGRAVVGEALTATSAQFSYATPPFAEDQYQWERCAPPEFTTCTAIGGATFVQHLLTEADLGSRLRIRERATYGPESKTVDAYSPNSTTVTHPAPATKKAAPELLAPFPVIAIGGVLTDNGANLSLLRVRGPLGALVKVRCIGPACPTSEVRRRIGANLRVRIRPLERPAPIGTQLIFRITKPGTIGKYTRLRIRAGRRPIRVDRCLQPGQTQPSPCPPR